MIKSKRTFLKKNWLFYVFSFFYSFRNYKSNINGWLTYKEKLLLEKYAKKSNTNILELGTYHGKSTFVLAKNAKHKVITVDDYSVDYYQGYPVSGIIIKKNNERIFLKNLLHSNLSKKIIKIKESSINYLKKLKNKNKKFDLIYIDASHDYEEVLQDLILSSNIINKHGFILVHDFGGIFSVYDVKQAVKETINKRIFLKVDVCDSIIVLKKYT